MPTRRPPSSQGSARGRRPAGGRRPNTTRVSLGGGVRLPGGVAPRKRPGQARSRDTVEAILRAAVELFSARGYAGTNTNDLADRAGVSVGSVYQYFPNKDAILTALVERHLQGVDAVLGTSLGELADPALPLRVAVRRLLERFQALHDHDPGLTRAVESQSGQIRRLPEAFSERERTYRAELERVLTARPDVRPGNHALMARLLFEIAETATAWLSHGGAAGFDRLEALDEATLAICRYVEAPPPGV